MNRFNVRLAIRYGSELRKLVADYSVNMSTGGVFIETVENLPVGTPLFVEFVLPTRITPVTCKARVVWTNEPGNPLSASLPPGMGLQFFCLSLENIGALRDFLNKAVCPLPANV